MQLEALEGIERARKRVGKIEPPDQTERDATVGHRVNEAAAELFHAQRVPERMNHCPPRQTAAVDLPELFVADRVLLGLAPFRQRQPRQDLLRQVAAHTVAEDREPGTDVDAWLERCLLLSFAIDPAVAGTHADDAVTLEEHFPPREPWE